MTERLLRYFREKQQDIQSEKTYDTQCPFCGMQCKMRLVEQTIVTRKKYTAIGIDNPTSQGRLCMKGMNAHQHALNSSRITRPPLKKNGEFMSVSWEEALNHIKDQVTMIQTEHGHDAMAVYGSASITNEEAYLLGKFARVGLQTKYIDYNGRLCMSAASNRDQPNIRRGQRLNESIIRHPHTRVIILAGTNIAECQPTIMPYFEKAKENGAYIIAIDPRETATTKIADLHLKIKPGTDAALANGLVKIIIDEQLINEDFIRSRTNGFEELKRHTDALSLNDISEQTSVPLAHMRKAAVKFAKETSGMLFTARGIEQQTDGTAAVKGFLNMVLITGKIGKPYSGYGAITGQGNGQGAREHGQKPISFQATVLSKMKNTGRILRKCGNPSG